MSKIKTKSQHHLQSSKADETKYYVCENTIMFDLISYKYPN